MSQTPADFEALATIDIDHSNVETDGWAKLDRLCDETRELNDASACDPIMFRTMERLDNVELGTPGALVHTLESCAENTKHCRLSRSGVSRPR